MVCCSAGLLLGVCVGSLVYLLLLWRLICCCVCGCLGASVYCGVGIIQYLLGLDLVGFWWCSAWGSVVVMWCFEFPGGFRVWLPAACVWWFLVVVGRWISVRLVLGWVGTSVGFSGLLLGV